MSDASARLAELFEHDDADLARSWMSIADGAGRLLTGPFSHEDLKSLAFAIPTGPEWLNPKAVDFNMPREPWQAEAAELVTTARRVAIELRALATYDRT